MRDLAQLPEDIFILIIAYLPPRTCILCRAVSRSWLAAFTRHDISLLLLRQNFPRCRETRLAAAALAAASLPLPLDSPLISTNLAVELQSFVRDTRSWSSTFAAVARRYHHLRHAKPRLIQSLQLAGQDRDNPSIFSFQGVAPWNRYLRLDQNTANFHYPDPSWSYSQEDGVLVYPAETRIDRDSHSADDATGYIYQALDLSTGTQVSIPFDVRQKHIRRVRLSQGVLVFEWAERNPYHQLNDNEVVHRHFVTAFDVIRISCEPPDASPGSASPLQSGATEWTWTVKFRSEWKLHFLGLPLNRSDRFFSAHTATHYAVYFWQPNRSLYNDDPIEQVAVWDISSPDPYRPSEDPTGYKLATAERNLSMPVGLWKGTNGAAYNERATASAYSNPHLKASPAKPTAGPQVIRRMAWSELGFYNLRQRTTPQLRGLVLDDRNLYFVEEDHRWADGQHSSLNPPRVHLVRCTGIPIIPVPASSSAKTSAQDQARNKRPSLGVIHNHSTVSAPVEGPVLGPVWVDACGADGDVNMRFCRRSASSSGPVAALESWSTPPRIQLGVLNNASPEYIMGLLKSRTSPNPAYGLAGTSTSIDTSRYVPNDPEDALLSFLSYPQRWPGWAPCWRHEDFPYLTIAEMVDFAAGVRITARHCFMLETLSVHVRPVLISVNGTGENDAAPKRDRTGLTEARRMPERKDRRMSSSGRSEEVQFSDDMWPRLLNKGYIAGDERWIVGEDVAGRVTIVRF